jgi:hypothetical protein
VRAGEPWGRAVTGAPDVVVDGDDAALAVVAGDAPGARVRFRPQGSDLARALGLPDGAAPPLTRPRGSGDGQELPVDAIALDAPPGMAMNAVVLGVAPDRLRWTSPARPVEVLVQGRSRFRGRATSIVIANGQHLRGADVVPRGHPGDGRLEIQVYELRRGERRAMRRRLPAGAHLPHPRVRQLAGSQIEVRTAGPALPVEVDGHPAGRLAALRLEVVPAAIWVLV